eukprot:3679080-Pleurochrysis_carterae.AAC.1
MEGSLSKSKLSAEQRPFELKVASRLRIACAMKLKRDFLGVENDLAAVQVGVQTTTLFFRAWPRRTGSEPCDFFPGSDFSPGIDWCRIGHLTAPTRAAMFPRTALHLAVSVHARVHFCTHSDS